MFVQIKNHQDEFKPYKELTVIVKIIWVIECYKWISKVSY